MGVYTGNSVSTADGIFYLKVNTSETASGSIQCACYIHISNAFSSAQPFELTYYANNKTKTTKKKLKSGTKKIKNVGDKLVCSFTVASYSVSKAISLKINGKTSKIAANKIKSTYKPNAPSNITLERSKPTVWRINVSGNADPDQPVNKVYLEWTNAYTPTPSSEWQELHNDFITYSSANWSDYFDVTVEEGQVYRFRSRVSGSKTGTEVFSTYQALGYAYFTNPIEPQVTYDDETGKFTWEADLNDIDEKKIRGWHIYRCDDFSQDVRYSQIDSVDAVSGTRYYEWSDPSSLVGKVYKYKIVSWNYDSTLSDHKVQECWDTAAVDVTIEGPPAKPIIPYGIQNVYYNSSNQPVIRYLRPVGVDELVIERKLNGSGQTWNVVATLTSGLSWTDDTVPTGKIPTYRCKYVNDAGESDYSETITPVGRNAPNPPTIERPVNGQNVMLSEGAINLYWRNNSVDGSPMDKGYVSLYLNGAWTTDIETSSQNVRILIPDQWNITTPGEYTWRVKTRCKDGLTSDYSTSTFVACTSPTLRIYSPTETVTTLPTSILFGYSDNNPGGGIKNITVSIINNEGDTVYEDFIDGFESTSIPLDYLFESEIEYTLRLDILSNLGIRSTAQSTIVVEYSNEVLAGSLIPIVDVDPDTGYGIVSVSYDAYDDEGDPISPANVRYARLFRYSNNEYTFIGEVKDGWQMEDKYAPVNQEFSYRLYQYYYGGQAAIVEVDAYNTSQYSFIYWGSDNICRAIWNPVQSNAISRPERTLVNYSGRKYPVSYDSKMRSETATFTAELEGSDLDDFIEMMQNGGTGIWKSVQGRAYDAVFDLDWQRVESKYPIDLYRATLKVTRIEGE